MKNIYSFSANTTQLAACLARIERLSMEAAISIDSVACDNLDPHELIYFNELATTLELMQSQLEYYFPGGDGVVDREDWSDALAALSSSAEWIGDQLLELEVLVGAKALADKLHHLSLSYIEAIPPMIATKIEQEGGGSQALEENAVEEPQYAIAY